VEVPSAETGIRRRNSSFNPLLRTAEKLRNHHVHLHPSITSVWDGSLWKVGLPPCGSFRRRSNVTATCRT